MYILRDKAIIQPEDILAMLIQYHIGDHHIADTSIEGCSLSQDVYTANLCQILHNLTQHAIGRHTQRIVDIQDDGLTPG